MPCQHELIHCWAQPRDPFALLHACHLEAQCSHKLPWIGRAANCFDHGRVRTPDSKRCCCRGDGVPLDV